MSPDATAVLSSPKEMEQIDPFRERARKLGADGNEEAFKAKLRAIARQKPKDESKPDKQGEN